MRKFSDDSNDDVIKWKSLLKNQFVHFTHETKSKFYFFFGIFRGCETVGRKPRTEKKKSIRRCYDGVR